MAHGYSTDLRERAVGYVPRGGRRTAACEIFQIPELPPGHTAIMNRASFHRDPRTRELIENAGCRLIYLPSYSPDLNKIESWRAVLKAKIKAVLPNAESLIHAIESAFQTMNHHKLSTQT